MRSHALIEVAAIGVEVPSNHVDIGCEGGLTALGGTSVSAAVYMDRDDHRNR